MSFVACFFVLLFHARQTLAVDDSSFIKPAVSHQWRSTHTSNCWSELKFPTEYPLTVPMMQKGMPSLSPQELHRFLPLITRLSQLQQQAVRADRRSKNSEDNVTVVSLGGSFAFGTQCCVGNSWPNRFVEWLRAAYPLVTIRHVEHLKGSTNSLYGASLLRELFEAERVDLLLLGYALNDEAAIFMSGNSSFLSVSEQIVRQASSSGTAVLYLVETLASHQAGKVYEDVSSYYSVPVISYRRAVRSAVKAAEKLKVNDPSVHFMQSKFSIFWPKIHSAPHPNWVPHQLISEMMAYTFTQIVNGINADRTAVASSHPGFPSNPVFFGAEVMSKTMCYPALASFSTLDESTEAIAESVAKNEEGPFWPSFAPYICSARTKKCKYNHPKYRSKKHELNRGYYRGWSFSQDRPGKPFGWITSSKERDAGVKFTHIAFPVELVVGNVSITYLASYENAGVMELWLSYIWVPHIDYSIMRRRDPPVSSGASVVGCCNNTGEKKRLYTHMKGLGHSRTTYIDTLQSSGLKASEIRTTTINFGMTGTFALNILHRTSSASVQAERGGDKVKVLGVRAC